MKLLKKINIGFLGFLFLFIAIIVYINIYELSLEKDKNKIMQLADKYVEGINELYKTKSFDDYQVLIKQNFVSDELILNSQLEYESFIFESLKDSNLSTLGMPFEADAELSNIKIQKDKAFAQIAMAYEQVGFGNIDEEFKDRYVPGEYKSYYTVNMELIKENSEWKIRYTENPLQYNVNPTIEIYD